MSEKINKLVNLAKEGDRSALESIVKMIQDRIFRLALKMLYQREDAEDAAQEILIRIITRLESFRQESSFETWAFTIAANHLKNRAKNQKERWFTFNRCEKAILKEIPDKSTIADFKAQQNLLVEEMRIICMQGLLQCLDINHRISYLLGASMGIKSRQAAEILEITPETFRKRLSRARERLREFLAKSCDLFDEENRCNCAAQAVSAVSKGRIDSESLCFSSLPLSEPAISDIRAELSKLDAMTRDIAIMQINQEFQAPEVFIRGVKEMLNIRWGEKRS